MNGAIIAIDVSKSSSYVQGFKNFKQPIGTPTKINHDLNGYKELERLANCLTSDDGVFPNVDFEYTGVYHKSIIRYCESIGLNS